MKLTEARPGDVLRGPGGRMVEIVNVFTAARDLHANTRVADYRPYGGGHTFRVYADEDHDEWERVSLT